MSRETVERIREFLPAEGTDLVALFAGARPPVEGVMASDMEVRFVAQDAEMSASGIDGFESAWRDWLEPWDSYTIHWEDLIDGGHRVICLTRLRGVTKRDRVQVEHESAAVITLDGERIVRVEFFLDREQALQR